MGLTKARGEWIIIQNPEVCTYSPDSSKDLLTYLQSADPSLYHVLEVYALPQQMGPAVLREAFASRQPVPALLLNIDPGDEVIVPSYTFVTTATAFQLRGATIVLADSVPSNPNVNVKIIYLLVTW